MVRCFHVFPHSEHSSTCSRVFSGEFVLGFRCSICIFFCISIFKIFITAPPSDYTASSLSHATPQQSSSARMIEDYFVQDGEELSEEDKRILAEEQSAGFVLRFKEII